LYTKCVQLTKTREAKGFNECRSSAKRGGQIAFNARKELEQETGEDVVSKNNFLVFSEKKRLEEKKKERK
jgi:hypothetical protein